uniref:triacylglycerol lipase n=1 Tax=Parastrongyloides trichosuri TaxID=131310 RepID=A0A0N5A3F3_PARTI
MHTHTQENIMSTDNLSLSFAGCGFLCIYHAGVCAAIKEYAPQLAKNKICGASAGSIAATFLLCDICISKATSNILQVVTQARSRALGALHPSFNLLQLVRDGLELALPENAHELCSGKLFISLTRVKDHQNVIVSQYDTKEELIQAIICSCFIPFYCGRVPPKFRGEQYVDGGISSNQPVVDENSITISPFSGESDICPMDEDSQSFFSFDFTGTNIRFTTRNLYRITVCLIPPSTEICSRICRQGFEDALRYLSRNGLAPCSRCLSIRSNAILMESQQGIDNELTYEKKVQNVSQIAQSRKRNISQRSSSSRLRMESECGECNDKVENIAVYLPEGKVLFPKPLVKLFDDSNDKESQLMEYLSSFKIVQIINYFVKPTIKPIEQLLTIINTVRQWIAESNINDYITTRFSQIFNFLWDELYVQKSNYTEKMSYQMVLTGFDPKKHFVYVKEKEKQLSLSKEAILELNLLRQYDLIKKKVARKASLSANTLEGSDVLKALDDTYSFDDDIDSLSALVKFTNEREAILSYHYRDDDDNIKVCEIFDIDHSKKHYCKNHNPYNMKVFTGNSNVTNVKKDASLPNIKEESSNDSENSSLLNSILTFQSKSDETEPMDTGEIYPESIIPINTPEDQENPLLSPGYSDRENLSLTDSKPKKSTHVPSRKTGTRNSIVRFNLQSSDDDLDNNDILFVPKKNITNYSSNYSISNRKEESDDSL